MVAIMASVEPQVTVISRSGIDGHALGALEFPGDGVAEFLGAPGDGVLIDVVGDGFARGFLDFLGGRENQEIPARGSRHCAASRGASFRGSRIP